MYYLEALKEAMSAAGNPSKAEGMMAYMKNKFDYFGIQQPMRKSVTSDLINQILNDKSIDLTALILELWDCPQREMQYVALDILTKGKKRWNERSVELFEMLITKKSWWDTVDTLSTKCVGEYFKKWPQHKIRITKAWNESGNNWLVRASILFQLKYKKETDLVLLEKMIARHISSSDFFIQKVIGWVLREYTRTDKAYVVEFTMKYPLKPLSKREALRLLK